jgi:hypothetical protein
MTPADLERCRTVAAEILARAPQPTPERMARIRALLAPVVIPEQRTAAEQATSLTP